MSCRLTPEWPGSTEQVSVLLSFGAVIMSEAIEACLNLLGRDRVTRRKIYINAEVGLKSSLLSLTAFSILKGAVDMYQNEKMCWDLLVRIGDKGWLILQSSGCWKSQWTLPTGR